MAAAVPGPRFYRSRRPERTLLYGALADQFARFLGVEEERFGSASEAARSSTRLLVKVGGTESDLVAWCRTERSEVALLSNKALARDVLPKR